MGENIQPQLKEINPETAARFRRESWWQISFPVVLTALALTAGAVLMLILGGPVMTSVVADYALGLLILLALIGGIILLAVIAVLVYGVSKIIGVMPPYTFAVQQFMQRVYEWVDHQTDRLANVLIVFKSAVAGAMVYLRARGLIPSDEEETPEVPPAAPSEPAE